MEAAGALVWFGRRRPWQRLAADAGVPPKALLAALQGARGGVERERASARFGGGAGARVGSRRVRQCGAAAQCARAKRALWARPEHARILLDEMPGRSSARGWGW